MNYKSAQHFYVKFLAAAIGNNVMIDNRCKHHTENYLTMIILVKQVVCSNKLNAYHNIMSLCRTCLFDEHPAVSASWPLLKINEVAVFAFFSTFHLQCAHHHHHNCFSQTDWRCETEESSALQLNFLFSF